MGDINKFRIKYIVADFLSVNVGWLLFNFIRYLRLPHDYSISLLEWLTTKPVLFGQLFVPVCMVLLYALSGSYNRDNSVFKSRLDELINTAVVSFIGMLGVYFTALINDNVAERMTNYALILVLFLCFFIPTESIRLYLTTGMARAVREGRYRVKALIIGASQDNSIHASRLINSQAQTGLDIIGFVDLDNENAQTTHQGLPIYRDKNLQRLCDDKKIEALIIMPSGAGLPRTAEIIYELYGLKRALYLTPSLYNVLVTKPRVHSLKAEPLIDISNARIPPHVINLKRVSDILISACAILVLLPVYAAIALAVKLDSRGPVFYRQERVGYHKKIFKIVKFRSMYTDAEKNGPALSSPTDPRITKVGHYLRKFRLDELPQFWNVLVGEMSVVGPRPEREYYVRQLEELYPAYSLVHQVRPGITSLGLVKFGYAQSIDEMLERLAFDIIYIENVSIGVDIKILLHTIITVVTGRGV